MQCSYCNTSLQIRRSATRIILEEDPWETCEIDYTDIAASAEPDDGTYRFEAEAIGPTGVYTAAFTPPAFGHLGSFSRLTSQNQLVIRDNLDWLVRTLYDEGWQSVSEAGGSWYNLKFRRRIHDARVQEWCVTGLLQAGKRRFPISNQRRKLLGMVRSGRDRTESATEIGKFFAMVLNGPRRDQIIAETEPHVAVVTDPYSGLAQAISRERDQHYRDDLVTLLEDDGWEYLHEGEAWWILAFRRPLTPSGSDE